MSTETLTVAEPITVVQTPTTTPERALAFLRTAAEIDELRGPILIDILKSFQDHGILKIPQGVDLYICDDVSDTGAEPSTGYLGDSPDIWVRNQPDGNTEMVHQNPIAGRDNWVYVRVHNRGTMPAPYFFVGFNHMHFTTVPLGKDFFPYIGANMGFGLPPGGSQILSMKWPQAQVPKPEAGNTNETCLLVSVHTTNDKIPLDANVFDSNNLAVKNVDVVAAVPGELLKVPVLLGNQFLNHPELFRLELQRPKKWEQMLVSLTHPDQKMEAMFKGTGAPADFLRHEGAISVDKGGFHLAYHQGSLAGFPVTLQPRQPVKVNLQITVPKEAKPGEKFDVRLVQRNREKRIIGGVTVQVNVVAKH